MNNPENTPARAMTRAEFAAHMGVNRSTVTRWLQNGRMDAMANGLIDPAAARRMLEATESPMPHHQARKAQFIDAAQGVGQGQAEKTQHAPSAPPAQTAEPMPAMEKIGAALKLETYKLQKAKAELANMEVDKSAGALVERLEVDFVLADFGLTARTIHDQFPVRYTHELIALGVPADKAHKFLEEVGAAASHELADHMTRKGAELGGEHA